MFDNDVQWFVMRDLTRSNAKLPAYQMLDDLGIKNYTPKVQKIIVRKGKRECKKVPFIHDLLLDYFMKAVETSESPQYFRPVDITPVMRKWKIRIIGGPLDGYEGHLITVRGSKVKRLLVELPALLAATVEVEPDFICLVKE